GGDRDQARVGGRGVRRSRSGRPSVGRTDQGEPVHPSQGQRSRLRLRRAQRAVDRGCRGLRSRRRGMAGSGSGIMSRVFDHLTIRVSDFPASRRFYDEALGLPTHDGDHTEGGAFGIVASDRPDAVTQRLHVAFGVEDRDAVDAWWLRMTEAGYQSDGEPGPRPEYSETYYGGFIVDPDGNSVEAVHHNRSRSRHIDHVWFRTRDVPGIRTFYETIAPVVGIDLLRDDPDRVRFSDGDGSFTFVAGDEPTHNVHI